MEGPAAHAVWEWEFVTSIDESPPVAVLRAYAELDKDDAAALGVRAVEVLENVARSAEEDSEEDSPRSSAIVLLTRLVCFVPGALSGLHGRLLDQHVLDALLYPMGWEPTILFQDADPAARDRMFHLLENAPAEGGPSALAAALAWVGDDEVRSAFARWQDAPPPWVPGPTGPDRPHWLRWITQRAGWTIDAGGERRMLYRAPCRRLAAHGDTSAASVGGRLGNELCPWCQHPLTVLVDLNLQDDRLAALGLSGTRLVVPTCEFCVCYATIYADVDLNGSTGWADENARPPRLPTGELDEQIPAGVRSLGDSIASPFEPMAFAYDTEVSFLGGAPTWIQNPDYPSCPRCGRLMTFLGQVDTHEVAWGEGTVYAFLDSDCSVAATLYQQT